MKKIAIFASGSGTNAQKILEYFKNHNSIKVEAVLSNKKKAKALERAKNFNVEQLIVSKENFYETDKVVQYLTQKEIDFIVLAGFLWLIPKNLIQAYPQKIVNIHPSLLPKFGGKGMYGMYVHQAVFDNKERESGISIHYVNEIYDEGQIIFQAKTKLEVDDQPEDIAKKVLLLEHKYFASIIEKTINNQI